MQNHHINPTEQIHVDPSSSSCTYGQLDVHHNQYHCPTHINNNNNNVAFSLNTYSNTLSNDLNTQFSHNSSDSNKDFNSPTSIHAMPIKDNKDYVTEWNQLLQGSELKPLQLDQCLNILQKSDSKQLNTILDQWQFPFS